MDIKRFNQIFDKITDNVNTVIHGKDDVVRLSMVAICAGGHILFEDVPGVGKSVLAAQNPVELAGTFPLPEAQLDRFLFKLTMGYPDYEAERLVMQGNAKSLEVERLDAVISSKQVLEMIELASEVTLTTAVESYI